MAFIDIFNYKKYFKKSSDATVARVGHVNAVYDALQTDSQPKFTVGTVTQTGGNAQPVTINTTAGKITMATFLSTAPVVFVVNNSEVTSNSIILLTPVVANFNDSNREVLVKTYGITNGSFTIAIDIVGSVISSNNPISINFLVINP